MLLTLPHIDGFSSILNFLNLQIFGMILEISSHPRVIGGVIHFVWALKMLHTKKYNINILC
jgi:hypothetical protein